MAKSTINQLSRIIQQLHAERQEHEDAIAKIDNQFDEFGISDEPRGRRRRPSSPKGAKKKVAKKRGKKAARKKVANTSTSGSRTSGPNLIFGFIGKTSNPTTGQINAFWKQSGGNYPVRILLSKLVKAKKLTRQPLQGERGSRYSLV